MSEWISVEDRLPEEGVSVLYYFSITGVGVGKYKSTEFGHCFYGAGGFLTGDVTHWMPLPEPPETS